MLRIVIGLSLVLVASTPALAFQCPGDIAKIDAALSSNPNLPASISGTVKTLRDTGQRLHSSGKHADSVQTLSGALDILKKAGVSVD